MRSPALKELETELVVLERDVERAQGSLGQLERALRATKIEAEAARDPAQFRSALLASRLRPGVIAGPLGFFAGLTFGIAIAEALAKLLH